MPKKNLHRQVKGMLEDKSDKLNLISGSLGITIDGQKTVEVSNREGYVWVRLRGSQSELIQAYNASVSPIFDLPVLVVRQGNKYAIYGRDIQRYDNWGITPYLPKHGTQHSFAPELGMGGDVTWVYSRQFVPMLASPSGTSGAGLLNINPYVYRSPDGTWEFVGDTATPNILPAKPTDSQARMMLLYWDLDTDAPAMLTGTAFSATLTGTSSVLPHIPTTTNSRKIPLAGIRLVSGTSVIGWDNIYDLRQFAVSVPPNFGGGFGIMDEGIIQGTGTILNFIGAGISAIVSGSIARITVTATGGGGDSLWATGSSGNFSITTKDGSNDSTANYALSHGFSTIAAGVGSHAEGNNTLASGTYSHAEGAGSEAYGSGAYAGGQTSEAHGNYSSINGGQGNKTFNQFSAIAGGVDNEVRGNSSAAIGGEANVVTGTYSVALGGFINYLPASKSVILGGENITGSADNTAYMPFANVRYLNSGTAVANVGINAQGFLVTGSTGGGTVSSVNGETGDVVLGAEDIGITDAGGYFTGTVVEAALQEIAPKTVTNGNSHNHIGGDGATISVEIPLVAHGNSGVIGAGATNYLATPFTALSATAIAALITTAGTIQNFYLRLASAQPASGSLVCTVTINGVDSAITFTVAAGSGAGNYSDTSNSAAVSAGDRVGFKLVNNAAGNSGQIGAMTLGLKLSNS